MSPVFVTTVNPIVSTDNSEYLILDSNLGVRKCFSSLAKYTIDFQEVVLGADVRLSFPELIGLEEICEEILNSQRESFILESVTRAQNEDNIVYFNILIKNVNENLVVYFEDVTELVNLRQSFIQKANEATLALNTLKRFECCTNKIIDSMEDILFITDDRGKIETTNRAAAQLLGYKKKI